MGVSQMKMFGVSEAVRLLGVVSWVYVLPRKSQSHLISLFCLPAYNSVLEVVRTLFPQIRRYPL